MHRKACGPAPATRWLAFANFGVSPFGKDNSFLRSDGYLKKRSDEMEKLNEWRNYKSSNPEHYVCDQYRLNYNLGKRLKIKEK